MIKLSGAKLLNNKHHHIFRFKIKLNNIYKMHLK